MAKLSNSSPYIIIVLSILLIIITILNSKKSFNREKFTNNPVVNINNIITLNDLLKNKYNTLSSTNKSKIMNNISMINNNINSLKVIINASINILNLKPTPIKTTLTPTTLYSTTPYSTTPNSTIPYSTTLYSTTTILRPPTILTTTTGLTPPTILTSTPTNTIICNDGVSNNGFYYPNIPNFINSKQEDVVNFFNSCNGPIPFNVGFTGNTFYKIIKQQYRNNTTPTPTDFTSINTYVMCAPIVENKNPNNFSVLFTLGQ